MMKRTLKNLIIISYRPERLNWKEKVGINLVAFGLP